MKFTTYSSGDTVVLQADCEGSKQGSIDFDIQVPGQTQLVRLETEGGSVAANNLSGRVEAKTGGGGIQLDRISGIIASPAAAGTLISARWEMTLRRRLEAEAFSWCRRRGM